MELKIEEIDVIARNDCFQFAVVRVGNRWLGAALESETKCKARDAFASEGLHVDPPFMEIFPEVSEKGVLGMQDKQIATLLTGAVAQDSEHEYGGIDTWLVPEDLRGDPEKFRCETCGDVGCTGDDCVRLCGPDEFLDEEG